ncbi:Schlafen-like protein 2 [Caenorhabditis elegans]|uniref:Schlafen-like protein 2 n=1 Tax=Caenorhabditis elegans TaxID=6239 RepID=SLFL2_CAEEL|nr:Protein tofu-2 [Caenorhabditis elegans]Q19614.3 RecName: Full=Protein tofu-2; AltName: Full=21U-RNA biogenesis fouled up protein 2 [Caenorhabditis elegans]CCD66547.1 Protein tofu-2 [Caenorhabditis elegans]|eukprot:NP_504786.2 Twenty One u-rna (21U-RNA) biogenesis Fouled Up [Caenorhabditis elegans]
MADTSPRESKLNKQDQDLHLEIDETGLACKSEVKKRWLGARGTAGLYGNGKYYYEVTITSKGLCRVGWATLGGSLNIGKGLDSFGYGGTGMKSTHKKFDDYGLPFTLNDVIGCYLDLDSRTIWWSKNGEQFPAAFSIDVKYKNSNTCLFPAVLCQNSSLSVNFGSQPFKFPPGNQFTAVSDAPNENVNWWSYEEQNSFEHVVVKLPFAVEEDVHNEFRMHTKLMLTELKRTQCKQDKDGSIRRTLQPISKTICAFLNTDGGRLFLGVNDDKVIKGISMSKNMIYHFFGSLRHMCENFKPCSPLCRIKVSILEVIPVGVIKVKLRKADLLKEEAHDFPKLACHSVGGSFCDCFLEINKAPTKQYLLIIQVSPPNPNSRTTIFQNEEGLVYRRRMASNKCVYLDDLRRMMNEKNQVFVDLPDEARAEIDSFSKFD